MDFKLQLTHKLKYAHISCLEVVIPYKGRQSSRKNFSIPITKVADLPRPSFWILEINHTTTLRKVTVTKSTRQHLEKITQKREDQTEHPVVSTNFQFQTSLLNEWLDKRTKGSLVGILTITMLQT